MIALLRPQPNARSVGQPEPAALGLLMGNLQPLTLPDTLETDLITKTGKARMFTFAMEAKSVITFPSGEMRPPGPGFYEITGLAWSGRSKIGRVEVSTDGGKTWGLAALQDPVLPICQTRFRFPWVWDGTAAILQSRSEERRVGKECRSRWS